MARVVQAPARSGEDAVLHRVLDVLRSLDPSAPSLRASVLDAGCGDGKYLTRLRSWLPNLETWALDAHAPSLAVASADRKILGVLPGALRDLPGDAVDAAVCLDVVEHLERADGRATLHELARVARELVVVFTPLGFMPQDGGGNEWQRHRSGWWPEDLEDLGFEAEVWEGFDYGCGKRADALWGVLRLG